MKNNKKAPLTVELAITRVLKLDFEALKLPIGEPAKIETAIHLAYDYKPKSKIIGVFVGVSIKGKDAPFKLDLEYQGIFQINRKATLREVGPLAKINCNALLFPYVQETIAEITRRGGYTPLHLESVNFAELAKQAESNTSKGRKKRNRPASAA